MPSENDELLDAFVTEANENLVDVENDFLLIEEAGANIDQDLVNKVFRGIHSMKGTSGFLGLKSIGKLAHEMENVLNLVRNRELVPSPKVVDVLLRGADTLRNMVNDIESSNDVDVSSHVRELEAVVSGETTPEVQESMNREIDVELSNGDLIFMMISEQALISRQRQGGSIYIIIADLVADVQSKDQTPLQFLRKVYDAGELIDSYVSTAGLGDLDDDLPGALDFMMLVSSTNSREELAAKLDVPQDKIHHIASPKQTDWADQGQPREPSADTADVPVPASTQKEATTPTPEAATPKSPAPAKTPSKSTKPPAHASAAQASLRVNVKVLDTLMNLAGELVLSRNQLMQTVEKWNDNGLKSVSTRIDQVTSELQEAIMQTRMQTIGTVFNKFLRIVRDLSKTLEKQCDLEIEGKDVELDKTIIEAIGDPLTHLIRNSVDHGVELPGIRVERGKSPSGKIRLSAFHQSGKVNIVISDDGAGIDASKLKKKAVEKGIITEEEAEDMSEREAVRLIFHPGFSMAEKVSDVSGRGVGMDVVRTNIEKLGGTVEINTELGVGTTITVKLPLTLAIIPSLVVRCGEGRYAIPQVNIRELVRINASKVASKIERVKDAEVLRLRGSLLPLARLSAVMAVQSKYLDPMSRKLEPNERENIVDRREGAESPDSAAAELRTGNDQRGDTAAGALNIIVLEADHLRYGLIVDGLNDSEEIVVKPLGRHMKECQCLAGATILGDGQVALILDVTGIASHIHLAKSDADANVGEETADTEVSEETQAVLLFTNEPNEQFSLPMSLITRIERIRSDQIDSVGGLGVLQYRGSSLPLLSLEDHIKAKPRPDQDRLNVVVFNISGKEVGLIAPQLIDISEIITHVDTVTFREPGVSGSVVVDGKVTRLIDIYELTEKAHPEWFANRPTFETPEGETTRILLAEDSGFFRTQVTKYLETDGYEVVGCEDGLIAWNTLQDPEQRFDMVVTDVEMPNMDGLELTRKIKNDPCLSYLPVIAVTSLAREEDIQRGYEAGVDDYQVKIDREKLLAAVTKHLKAYQLKAGLDRAPVSTGGKSS